MSGMNTGLKEKLPTHKLVDVLLDQKEPPLHLSSRLLQRLEASNLQKINSEDVVLIGHRGTGLKPVQNRRNITDSFKKCHTNQTPVILRLGNGKINKHNPKQIGITFTVYTCIFIGNCRLNFEKRNAEKGYMVKFRNNQN